MPENSGANATYYDVQIDHPIKQPAAYCASAVDIVTALDMNHAEGEAFYALWRKAAARQGRLKEGNSPLRDAEKAEYYCGVLKKMELERFRPPQKPVVPEPLTGHPADEIGEDRRRG